MNRNVSALNPSRILILKFGALGDVVLITAALKSIRERYPAAHITCLVGEAYVSILQDQPVLNAVIPLPQVLVKRWQLGALFQMAQQLRRECFDLLIDFQNNKKSHLLGWLSRIPYRLGYDRKWGVLLNLPVTLPNKKLLPADHQYAMLAPLSIKQPEPVFLSLQPSEAQRAMALVLLKNQSGPFIGINLSASVRWQTKQWEVNNLIELLRLFNEAGYQTILNGTLDDRDKAEAIVKASHVPVINLVGRANIPELLGVIAQCDLFISPDTAPLHMAAALNVPVIGLFGPTDPERYAPPTKNGVMLSSRPPCAPCHSPVCLIGTHSCMQQLTAKQVFNAACQLGVIQ